MSLRTASASPAANDLKRYCRNTDAIPTRNRIPMTTLSADYVIVGAGSAGCAIAYRLAQAGRSVIVIEYGGSDAGPFINMPGALSYP